jgi:hypothetical protein
MRVVLISLTVLALAACDRSAETTAEANVAATPNAAADVNAVATPAAFDIKGTSWEFTEDGKPMVESIDADGNYIANAGTEHADHGTAVMKDGKACFTSAMNDEGEVCWTNPNLEVGQSGETTSDKGEKLTVKRIEYVALTM